MNKQDEEKVNEMMSEEYGSELKGCLLCIFRVLIIFAIVAGCIYLFT